MTLSKLLENSLKTNSNSDLLPSNIGIDNQNINVLISDYNIAVINRDKLANSGGVNNPRVKQAVSQVENLKTNINNSLRMYISQLELSRQQLGVRNQKFIGKVSRIPEKEKLLRAINRQQKIKESLYVLLLQKREEAAINLAITEPSIKVVEYALSGSNPISPKPNIVYAGAILGGLLIPFGILYLIFMLDTKLHSKEDIMKLTSNIPVIAEIPDVKKSKEVIFKDLMTERLC